MSSDIQEIAIRPKKEVNDVGEEMCRPCGEGEQHPEERGDAKKRIKKMLNPKLPSQEDIDLHMLTYLP